MALLINNKHMLFTERKNFLPFEYPWVYEDYWFAQQNAHWLHTEINMQNDIKDWEENLDEKEKNVIGNILKGFTQTETEVGNYWSALVPAWFPKPEIKMMAQTFGAFETIHARAYSYLNEILGLDDFEAFLDDEATMEKLSSLIEVNDKHMNAVPSDTESMKEVARSLALFSAAAEGIQLFSSFAILLSFRKSNRLTGIGQQMIFSVRDESLHSEAGCRLFRQICQEYPEIWDDKLKGDIYEGIEFALRNEFHYLNMIFEMGDLSTITKEQVKNFMYDRANRKLEELGLKAKYIVESDLMEEMSWFYSLVSGEQQTDFFSNRETGYAKPNDDWNHNDLYEHITKEDNE